MEAVSQEVQQWRLRALLSMSKLSQSCQLQGKRLFWYVEVLIGVSGSNFKWGFVFFWRGQIALKCSGPYNKPDVIKVQICVVTKCSIGGKVRKNMRIEMITTCH